ncbi:hypothetical protein AXG93_115s1340 [Marchantia polymorpha subsp. ruderalis]|uniref:Uncharacterized protein n=1 Tax=Marchantia polymorpha subsp. ruderalis TaxID=1480154 RepID=A0A176W613_MARPO|nr:hypothetical protein AXG93_115s1340 [Marchantia polymorpha subsp. ruderalis]
MADETKESGFSRQGSEDEVCWLAGSGSLLLWDRALRSESMRCSSCCWREERAAAGEEEREKARGIDGFAIVAGSSSSRRRRRSMRREVLELHHRCGKLERGAVAAAGGS